MKTFLKVMGKKKNLFFFDQEIRRKNQIITVVVNRFLFP